MNIRNISQLKSAHYTGSGDYNSSFLIAAPGAGKHIAIYAICNWSGASVKVTQAANVSDTGGAILFACKDGMISLEAPIIAADGDGILVDQTGVTILYTIIDNSVAGGAY
tara:strand:+ start:426 stop:755 length:330 start_codon:yes stop_codon:yes gene_type:complete